MRHASFPIYPAPLQGSHKCRDDRLDAAIAAAFGDKPATRSESSIHRGQHRIGALDPVKNCATEYADCG